MLTIRPVQTDADNDAFLRMPWQVYADDLTWAAPLWREHVHYFDPAHNPELQHIDMEKFVAWRDDKPIGTIIAFINHAYNDYQGENVGWFGQFELLNDPEAADALLEAAEAWVRERGVDKIMGPATYSTNSEIGLLVEGFEHPQVVLMPHARPYYQGFIEAHGGYTKTMDLWALYIDGNDWGGLQVDKIPPRVERVAKKIKERRNFTVRQPDMSRFTEEVNRLKEVYNAAWSKNWGFIPMDDTEIDHLADELKPMVDTNIIALIEHEDEVAAFTLPLPDVYQPLRKANCKPGEPHWWQLAKLLWHWKVRGDIDRVRIWGMGIVEKYRRAGMDALLFYEMMIQGLPRGYRHIDMSWILETNDAMNQGLFKLGAEVYKIYRVYEKPL